MQSPVLITKQKTNIEKNSYNDDEINYDDEEDEYDSISNGNITDTSRR